MVFKAFTLAAALAASLFHLAAAQTPTRKLEMIPISSANRLEDLFESPDGTRLLTHDRRFAPRLWDPKTMRILRIFGGHQKQVNGVAMSHSGRRILTYSSDLVQVWDSKFGTLITQLPAPANLNFSTANIAPNDDLVCAGTDEGKLVLVSLASPNPPLISNIGSHIDSVRMVEFSPDSKQILSSGFDNLAKIWNTNLETPKINMAIVNGEGVLWGWWSADGKHVLTTFANNVAALWDAETGKMVYSKPHYRDPRLFAYTTNMSAMFCGKDDRYVLIADESGTMHLLNRTTGAEEKTLKGHTAAVREIRKSRDGLYIGTYGADEQLKLWDVEKEAELPFDRPEDGPTAADFSADCQAFWVGYDTGAIRRHNLKTGRIQQHQVSAVTQLGAVNNYASDMMYIYPAQGSPVAMLAKLIPLHAPGSMIESRYEHSLYSFSPNGEYGFVYAFGYTSNPLINAHTGSFIMGYKNVTASEFSYDSKYLMTGHEDSLAFLWKTVDGDVANSLQFTGESTKGKIDSVSISPDGNTLFTCGHKDNRMFAWDFKNGTSLLEAGPFDDSNRYVKTSPDGKTFAYFGNGEFSFYDYEGKTIARFSIPFNYGVHRVEFNTDGSRVLMITDKLVASLNLKNPETAFGQETAARFRDDDGRISTRDGHYFLTRNSTQVKVFDAVNEKEVAVLDHVASVVSHTFSFDDKRILTVDDTGWVTLWNLKGEKLGNFIMMGEFDWLVTDVDGRYDASDPGNVSGASYVLQWDGGLEPIDVAQLKAGFYEPGLLEKLLGLSSESVRTVPKLDSLRLYPEVELEKSGSKVTVSLHERDQGGIGKVNVLINGKVVTTKTGTGYFTVDTAAYQQYLLPEVALKSEEGETNVLQVTVTNEKGDLVSPAQTIDLGVPAGLKAPEVNLYALFVGVGDYVGETNDLLAPPSDAAALETAIETVSKRLLSNRVHATLLSTATSDKPTRNNIRTWFEDVSKKATSSDIVMVYLSGHGTNVIGENRGYYFLTMESDPGTISPTMLGVSTVSGEDLKGWLTQIPAGKQVVILDSCHSGAAAGNLIEGMSRSVAGDFQRAYESLRDGTGVWMLAGSAADQLSYESSNVEHGMLTYSLLEAIDRANGDGLRRTPSGEMFVDVENWLSYAANRVESLKNEVGIKGVQKPELKRSGTGRSFDIGVTSEAFRGQVGLKPPRPIVIVGTFQQDEEDPIKLEPVINTRLKDAETIKPWFDIAKHPDVYRVAGTYSVDGASGTLKVFLQRFDHSMARKTLETFEIPFALNQLPKLADELVKKLQERISALEDARMKPPEAVDPK